MKKRKTDRLSASFLTREEKKPSSNTRNIGNYNGEIVSAKVGSIYNDMDFEETLATFSLQEEKDIDRLVARKERYLRLIK